MPGASALSKHGLGSGSVRSDGLALWSRVATRTSSLHLVVEVLAAMALCGVPSVRLLPKLTNSITHNWLLLSTQLVATFKQNAVVQNISITKSAGTPAQATHARTNY